MSDQRNEYFPIRTGVDVRISHMAYFSRPELAEFGDHCAVDPFVIVTAQLTAESYVHIASHCSIIGGSDACLVLCNFSGMAAGCRIICGSDDFNGSGLIGPMIPQQYRPKSVYTVVVLEQYAYLATGVIVFPGVTIGEGSVVGAGSVVTHNLPPWGVFRGSPARFVKERPRDTVRAYAKELMSC